MNTILGLIRHLLTFLGGYLVASGVIPEAMLDELLGAVMTIVGFIWSVYDKRARAGSG